MLKRLQIWFIGRTLASQAGKAGSIPVICFIGEQIQSSVHWKSQCAEGLFYLGKQRAKVRACARPSTTVAITRGNLQSVFSLCYKRTGHVKVWPVL